MPKPRKSLAEHALAGTKPTYEVDVRLSAIAGGKPRVPKDFSPELRKVFKSVCKLLAERRQLTPADGESIRLYCIAHARHKDATEHLRHEGSVRMYTRFDTHRNAYEVEKANLYLKVAEVAEKTMIALLLQLGLTAAARDRIKQVKPEEHEEAVIPGSIEDMRRQGLLGNVIAIVPPVVDLTQEIEQEKKDVDNSME
jgi:P27 family predicted phage terminase small subunit